MFESRKIRIYFWGASFAFKERKGEGTGPGSYPHHCISVRLESWVFDGAGSLVPAP